MAKGDDQTETVLKEPTVNREVHQATADQCSAYPCDSALKMHGSMSCTNAKVSQGTDDLCFTSDRLECPSEESYSSDSKTKLGTILHSNIVFQCPKVKKSNNNTPSESGKEERKRHGYHRGIAFSVWGNNKSSRDSGNMVVVVWSGKNHKDKSSVAKQRRDKLLNRAFGPRKGQFFQDIRARFQLTNGFSSRPWFSSMEMQIQQKETESLTTVKSISSEIYACLTLKTGWKTSESTTNKEGMAQQYGIAILVGIDPSSCQCNVSKNLKLSKNAAVTSRERESSDDASIEFTIECPAEVLDKQLPPHALQDVNTRIGTFRRLGNSLLPTENLARHGFFCNDNNKIQCHSCLQFSEVEDIVRNPGSSIWHYPHCPYISRDGCPFMRGENCGNVLIATHFNQLYGNLSTRPTQGNPGEDVIQQQDPLTGATIQTVRYPADLPERIRQTGGMFEIGPTNRDTIQSGPGTGGKSCGPGLREAPAGLLATPLQQAQHQPMRQWRMANVISADHKRFLIKLYLNRELDRVASFACWPTERPNVAPAALAKTGFFYLGDMDRTQCFSCGGVLRNWTAEDDAASEHRAHFPNCRLFLGTETRNIPIPDLPVATDVRQRDFPCRFPSKPHMRSEAARVETFGQRWPRNRTAATPAEIAQAGFFYLGERDRVKCWYCVGGLQRWEYDDVPWIEHAKWFPNCQFLLSMNGQHFVYRHLAMCPQLPRPIIARQDGSFLDPGSERQPSQPPEDIPPGASRVRQLSPPPFIIDPQEEMRKKQERIDSVLKNSDLVKNILAMGFSEQIVRRLLEKVDSGTEESPDDIYGTTLGLLDDVMKREEKMKQEEEQRSNIAAAVPPMPGSSTSYMPSGTGFNSWPGYAKSHSSHLMGNGCCGPPTAYLYSSGVIEPIILIQEKPAAENLVPPKQHEENPRVMLFGLWHELTTCSPFDVCAQKCRNFNSKGTFSPLVMSQKNIRMDGLWKFFAYARVRNL